jgi:hypothetical protein
MSRTDIEAKLPWKQVPKGVRQQVDAACGSRVIRAARIWGGYSPAPTFRLTLADGRRAFFKAIYGATNEFATAALHQEERVYHDLGRLLEDWIRCPIGSLVLRTSCYAEVGQKLGRCYQRLTAIPQDRNARGQSLATGLSMASDGVNHH